MLLYHFSIVIVHLIFHLSGITCISWWLIRYQGYIINTLFSDVRSFNTDVTYTVFMSHRCRVSPMYHNLIFLYNFRFMKMWYMSASTQGHVLLWENVPKIIHSLVSKVKHSIPYALNRCLYTWSLQLHKRAIYVERYGCYVQ